MPRVEARLGTVTIRLDGDLEGPTCDHLVELVALAMGAGAVDVHVDASHVAFAGSAGIRALLEARAEVLRHDGRFTLDGVPADLRRLLDVLGLQPVFAS